MRFCPVLFLSLVLLGATLRAQSTVPTVTQAIPTQVMVFGGPALTLDLSNYISLPGVTGQVAQFDTVFGRFNVELRADAAPQHVANFLAYVRDAAYAGTFFHRAASFEAGGVSILQGGGFRVSGTLEVTKRAPVPLEYNLANSRGTLAAARTSAINSATSEWYFNVRDNTNFLGQSNGGGYTVFGRVLGTGMTVIDTIAVQPVVNASGGDPNSAFATLPVRDFTGGTVGAANVIIVNTISPIALFPAAGGAPSVLQYAIENSAPTIVTATLAGSTITLAALNSGRATITVRAVDTNGNATQTSFVVEVTSVQPEFLAQPSSQTVAAGSTVVFYAPASAASAYQWLHDNRQILGATSATLVVRNATAADAGSYVNTAINSIGQKTSNPATLTLANVPEAQAGRLANLSVLTSAGTGSRVLTVGAVVGPLNSAASLPLVIRGIGPTLGQEPFNVPGVLADPIMTVNARGVNQPIATNDDWGGGLELANAFTAVGAFALPAASRDAAIVRPAPGLAVGNYTVEVGGKGQAQGVVLAEMYDAAGASRTDSTPRLINLSVLKQLDPGEGMTAGFVIQGQSPRTVLVRAAGPALAAFAVGDPMQDPVLALYRGSTKIAENDNWGGEAHLSAVGTAVGAFPIADVSSRDAMLTMTLAPGDYTARVSGVNGGGGNVIVEVYEVR